MPRSIVALTILAASCCGPTSKLHAAAGQKPPAAIAQGVDVRTFGAVGDGKADDTAAIQKAVDAKCGGLLFSRGHYRLTKPIRVELDRVGPTSFHGDGTARLIMAGAGPAIHLIGTHGGTASPHTFKPNVWARQRMPLIDGLEILGEHPEAVGVRSEGVMQVTFSRLLIRRALHGIHLVTRNRNVIVSDCHLYHNHGVGLFLEGVDLHQINVVGSHISYNGGGGIVLRHSSVRNLHIGTCDIEANMAEDGPPTANVLIETHKGEGPLRNWDVREGAIVGCTIQHTHQAPDSANIRFVGREGDPVVTVGRFTIADNVLSDAQVNIHLVRARGVTITGNTLWRGFAHNLLVQNSTQILVANNLFERNPVYKPSEATNGLVFEDCTDSTLSANHVHYTRERPAAITLDRCRGLNVVACQVTDCEGVGILMRQVQDCRLSDCILRAHKTDDGKTAGALRLESGRDNIVVNNIVTGSMSIAPETALVKDNIQRDR